MGIHGLSDYLKKEAPEYVQQVDVKALGIRRVALDGHQWMTMATKKTLAEAYAEAEDPWAELSPAVYTECRQAWLRQAVQVTCSWMDLGMEPLWVFDGPAPAAKATRKAERAADRDKAATRLEELRTETQKPSVVVGGVGSTWLLPTSDRDVRSKILSLRQQLITLQPEWQDALLEVLNVLGVPWVVGTTEGEKVACMLWRDGRVDAVMSSDTDCLVYGCTRVITAMKATCVGREVRMPLYARDYILEFLEMGDREFVDFCIGCGCDYNTNVPRVGPVKVHALMKAHGTLDAWPATYKGVALERACLNADECRALFAPVPSADLVASASPSLALDRGAWRTCDDALLEAMGRTAETLAVLQCMGMY